MPVDPALVKSLFIAASEITDPAAREALLAEGCGPDTELRKRVEALLRAHEGDPAVPGPPLDPTIDPSDPTRSFAPFNPTVGLPVDASPPAEHPGPDFEGAEPDLLAGRYRLGAPLGEGGMGSVYRAEQVHPVRRPVAIKLIRTGMDSARVVARFDAERQALAVMDHPHIAKVLDAGTTPDGRPFFAMELVEGVPLNQYCDDQRLSVPARLGLFVQVCQAVQHAHQKGVIHRDLKPGNILVTEVDGKPVPKVIDFGLAKALDTGILPDVSVDGIHSILGTPLYMAPEQADPACADIDTRADVYALGVILYELLVGSTPLTRETLARAALAEVLRQVREVEPQTPVGRLESSDALPSIAAVRQVDPARLKRLMRGDLEWVAMKCLEKDRGRRYDTANGLVRDIERYLADELVEARPPSPGYRLRKFVRRNKGRVVAATLVLLALLVGLVGTTIGLIEARRQEGIANEAREREAERAEAEVKERKRAEAAEIEAKKQEAAAREQLEVSNALTRFLQWDVIMQASSRQQADRKFAPNPNLTVREAIDRAALALATQFKDRPVLEASIRYYLGHVYLELGQYEKAIAQLQRTADLRRRALGAENVLTLNALNGLGLANWKAGNANQAVTIFEQLRTHQSKARGPDQPIDTTLLNNLALSYQAAGRTNEAIALFEAVRNSLVKDHGPEHRNTLTALNNLALAYKAAGRTAEAITAFQRARDGWIKTLGPNHPDTLIALFNLAAAYHAGGQTADAIALYEKVRQPFVKSLGPDYPHTLQLLHNLGALYQQLGKPEAIGVFEQIRDIVVAKHGPHHPDTLSAKATLGVAYRDGGLLAKAIPLLEEVHRASGKVPSLRWVGLALLDGYARAGKTAEAIALAREEMAAARASIPPNGQQQAAGPLVQVGSLLLTARAFAEAEPLLRECLTIREKKEPDSWTTFNTRSLLGEALLGQKKLAEAEPLLLSGYEEMRKRADKIPATIRRQRLEEALDRLIALSRAINKAEDVKKWQAAKAGLEGVKPK